MAKKKTKPNAGNFNEAVFGSPGGGETIMCLGKTAENNVHAEEEVVVADNPSTTPGTSADNETAADAGKESELEPNEPTTSPYACSPVAIDVGPGLATYWVPPPLLRSPKWSTTDAGGTLCLRGVSAATGHTLVHYLYTGTYQALEAKGENPKTQMHTKFRQALLTFILASTYELPSLERLAKEQIKRHGSYMALDEVLDTVRKEFSKMTWCWFHKYLQARAEEQFELDYAFFTSKAFIESVGKGTLHRFMTSHLLEVFSNKLTDTLQMRGSRCQDKEKPDVVLDEVENAAVQTHHCSCYHSEHQAGMYKASDEMSFEFPNASCEDADEVISLENSVRDETLPTPPGPETAPPHETEPPTESEPEPVPESSHVKEEEKTERKKEDGEAIAAAAAATSASADVSRADTAPANDGWDSFVMTAPTSKKKKKKKGKADPIPPPPPPPLIELTTTYDDIKLNDVNLDDGALIVDIKQGNFGTANLRSGFELDSSWGSSNKASCWGLDDTSKDASGGGDNPWDSADKKKKYSSGFDFDFATSKGTAEAVPAAKEKPLENDFWGFGAGATKPKKGKKGALAEEPIPESEPIPAPEPGKKEEEDPWAFSFGTTGKEKKKKKKGAIEVVPPSESEPPAEPDPEPEPEPVPESEPVKEEEDSWGATAFVNGKKKKGKKAKEEPKIEEYPPPPAKPEPEPVTVKEEKNEIGDLRFSSIWSGSKKKKKEKNAEPDQPVESEPEFAKPLAIEAAVQDDNVVEKSKVEEEDEWGMLSWCKKKKDHKNGARVDVIEDTTTSVQKPEEDDPWGSAAFNIGKKSKKKKKKGEVVDETLTKTTSKESASKSVEDMVDHLALVDDDQQKREHEAKEKKAREGVSMLVPEEPEPTAEPVPAAEQEAFPDPEQEYNPKPESILGESFLEASSTLCSRRFYHLLEGDRWKSCKRCRAMLRGIAVELAEEDKNVSRVED